MFETATTIAGLALMAFGGYLAVLQFLRQFTHKMEAELKLSREEAAEYRHILLEQQKLLMEFQQKITR